ncbi:hypothetical protein GCM10011487_65790 [Steroidobacter agaridevorans]|uniref:Uncharacterized protein n=1 Tax=Steroidobacter agaridevorans TaxID=2695856 RepID=A0A829YN46_9GAMM|nr:hypothetical protein GCM10011487_65790 [Steroidobacter agaridevorans]GFE90978.1 hypothetical protein GCM10011488_59320 [Steroidobacter agaridevorans]
MRQEFQFELTHRLAADRIDDTASKGDGCRHRRSFGSGRNGLGDRRLGWRWGGRYNWTWALHGRVRDCGGAHDPTTQQSQANHQPENQQDGATTIHGESPNEA